MAAIYRTQVSFASDINFSSITPRDYVTVTPWFRVPDPSATLDTPDAIADNLVHAFTDTGSGRWVRANVETTAKVYIHDPGSTEDGPPVATKTLFPSTSLPSQGPREVAVCLSYYSVTNRPGRRGRLYLPMSVRDFAAELQSRPGTVTRNAAVELGKRLATAVGGPLCDWILWSKKDQTAHGVTDIWVDDEWDTVRSRGLRATTRTTAHLTEAP